MVDHQVLKTELDTDPNGYGYSALEAAGDRSGQVAALNLPRTGIEFDRTLVDAHELFEQIEQADWTALSDVERSRIELVLGMGVVNVQGTNTRSAFQTAFAGTQTLTNLVAFQKRLGSRAEELFGEGVSVSIRDVAEARAI